MKTTRNLIVTLLVGLPFIGAAFAGNPGLSGLSGTFRLPADSITANSDSVHMGTVIDEVIWVIGDEAILKSDVETYRMQAAMEGVKWNGDPDCMIPEQIAVQKLFKHQAQIDSIEVTDADVAPEVEQHINYWLEMVDGSRERLEEYRHKPLSQIRNDLREELKDRQMVQKMKRKLVEDIAVTPAEVRRSWRCHVLHAGPSLFRRSWYGPSRWRVRSLRPWYARPGLRYSGLQPYRPQEGVEDCGV